MKKIVTCLTLLAVMMLTGMASFAAPAATNWDSAASLKRINTIGKKIMTANKLPTQIAFKVSDQEDINAYANIDKEVYVYKGLLNYVENDDELAAVIAHEIGHIINSHIAKQTIINSAASAVKSKVTDPKLATGADVAQQLSLLKVSRSDEYDADVTGAELMLKAGYNPLYMISILNKITSQSFDVFATHPSGEKRLLYIWDFLDYSYPQSVKNHPKSESFKSALNYIYATMKERNANPKKLAKHKKEMEKLKQKRIKNLKKAQKQFNGWDTTYFMLNSMQ